MNMSVSCISAKRELDTDIQRICLAREKLRGAIYAAQTAELLARTEVTMQLCDSAMLETA